LNEDAYPDLSEDLLVAYCGAPHVSKDVNATWVRQFVSGKTRQQWRQIARLSRGFSEAMRQMDFPAARAFMNQETEIRCRLTPEVLDAIGQPLVAAAIRRLRCAVYRRRRRRVRMGLRRSRGSLPRCGLNGNRYWPTAKPPCMLEARIESRGLL
jgi:hypothetical protein